MKVKTKNGIIEVEIYENKESYIGKDFYETIAYNARHEQLGFVNFHIKDNRIWIWLIETEEKFQHKGVGQALLNTMEYVAVINKCDRIEGKYYPKNSYARDFYLKNNYDIDSDDYDQMVLKYIDQSDKTEIVKRMVEQLKSPFEIKAATERERNQTQESSRA